MNNENNVEMWKDIKGYEGLYQISNTGKIFSYATKKNLSIKNKTGWYLRASLYRDGKTKTFSVHRLVAEHFLENPKNLPVVNHKDLNKQNNYVDNLEWVTVKDNILHCLKNKPEILRGLHKTHQGKKVVQKKLTGEIVNIFKNAKIASEQTGICSRNILQVANREEYKPGKKRKQAGGFIWEFKNE